MDIVTEANGRLRFGRKRTVAFVLICLAPFFAVLVRSRPSFEEAVVRVVRAVHSCCDGQRNPSVATLHGGSFDPWGECPELRGEWKMHHADVLFSVHGSLGA